MRVASIAQRVICHGKTGWFLVLVSLVSLMVETTICLCGADCSMQTRPQQPPPQPDSSSPATHSCCAPDAPSSAAQALAAHAAEVDCCSRCFTALQSGLSDTHPWSAQVTTTPLFATTALPPVARVEHTDAHADRMRRARGSPTKSIPVYLRCHVLRI